MGMLLCAQVNMKKNVNDFKSPWIIALDGFGWLRV